jgi:PleD family two-component response regulator
MQDGGWPVTISCGVVTFRTPPDSAEEAIKAADHLMYQVKGGGKNAIGKAVYEGKQIPQEV